MSEIQYNKSKLFKWLNKKWPKNKRICEICRHKNWTFTDRLVTPIMFNNGRLHFNILHPSILVICCFCGNTKTFNAKLMDLIEDMPQKNVSQDAKSKITQEQTSLENLLEKSQKERIQIEKVTKWIVVGTILALITYVICILITK